MNHNANRLVLGTLCAIGLSACALTSRSEPMQVRYFTVEDGTTSAPNAQPTAHQAIELRIGRVDASNYLGEEIAFRDSKHELQFDELQRWTEKPEEYLRRALTRTLYQERGLTRAFTGAAPTLDVELVQFEEVRGPQPKVRVQCVAILHDERRSQFDDTVTIERPIAANGGEHSEAMAAALSSALQAAVANVADRVVATLASGPAVATTTQAP